ncbi:MAG: alpha/beta hydrolase [Desulfobacterales bacterium]|nr:alpha/beta hydrolase [Desulfobacterales bacterium]
MRQSGNRCGLLPVVLCILLFLFILSGCGLFVAKLPSGQVPHPAPENRFVTIDGVRFHYESYPGTGKTIVLLHGFGSSTYTWKEVIPQLRMDGYRVLALDMKGFGWSDKPAGADYSPKALMEEVNAWMERMGLEGVTFVGNSLGGAIGLMLAMDHPERMERLVLIDSGGYPITKPLIIQIGALPLIRDVAKLFFGRWLIRANMNRVFFDRSRVTPERVAAYFDRMRTTGALEAQMALSAAIDEQFAAGYIQRIPQIRIPTLILWGENDAWIPLANGRRFHGEIPDSRLVVIPRCGHVPQEEAPKIVSRSLSAFAADRPLPQPLEILVNDASLPSPRKAP